METLFPWVERSTLAQIIENWFKPTNIYRLLPSEKERAETQWKINIGGIELEQTEGDGKESEYRMSSFFKAWAAYSGILVKLAPEALQGELATTVFIYTMSLYDLLGKYTWDGVQGYHFQFHRKRVAGGKSIYLPQEWRQLDSELIASKCFAHPLIRTTWTQSTSRPTSYPGQISELPLRENTMTHTHTQHSTRQNPFATSFHGIPDRRLAYNSTFPPTGNSMGSAGTTQTTSQLCRNWNYWECRTTACRHQHICIGCGGNHKAAHCQQAGSTSQVVTLTSRYQGR